MKKDHGFTLIELMVVIALIALIAALGFPGMQDLSANNKLMTNANDIVGTFHQARSEALRRSTTVTVQACKPGCDPGGGGAPAWSNGWQVWVDWEDTDGDGTVDTGEAEEIAKHDPLPAGMSVGSFSGSTYVTSYDYNTQGRLDITSADAFQLCVANSDVIGRVIRINPIGRLSVEKEDCP